MSTIQDGNDAMPITMTNDSISKKLSVVSNVQDIPLGQKCSPEESESDHISTTSSTAPVDKSLDDASARRISNGAISLLEDEKNKQDRSYSSLQVLYEQLLNKIEAIEKKMAIKNENVDGDSEGDTKEDSWKPPDDWWKLPEDNPPEPTITPAKRAEQPFLPKDAIKYVKSEDWCKPEIRRLWVKYTGAHTLVVSMKSSGGNPTHQLSESVPVATKTSDPLGVSKEKESQVPNGNPDRLAIVSPSLLAEVSDITKAKLTNRTNVLVAPFKVLVPFYDDFLKSVKKNEDLAKEHPDEARKGTDKTSISMPKESEQKDEEFEQNDKNPEQKDEEEDAAQTPSENDWEIELRDRRLKALKLSQEMRCLLQFMNNNLRDTMEVHRHIMDGSLREIAFEHLWYLFKPGDLVVSTSPKPQAYQVMHIGGGRILREESNSEGKPVSKFGPDTTTDFFLDCYNLDFNGTHYGPVPKQILISPYEGLRQIATLDVVPISFLGPGKNEKIEETLITRGKRFLKLTKQVSHTKYKGLNLKEGNFRHEEVDGDAIIDFALAFKNSTPPYEIEPPTIGRDIIEEPTKANRKETTEYRDDGCSTQGHCLVLYLYDDSEFDLARRTEFLNSSTGERSLVHPDSNKTKKLKHILFSYRVYGYVLLSRKWYPLDIDLVEDIKEEIQDSQDGFQDLVLPEDHKQIVRALVKTHAKGPRLASSNKVGNNVSNRDIDLVKGKGKGLIILLHGVPGVGKTSTAECVAANTNRPLFPITCGDIGGTTAKDVETNLESYFDLARKWGCVLLLDEADVFLGERTKGDIVQNSLVSVFLRVLEYYSGILILTTNRVGQFDEAIKSRIHISLYYPPLNKQNSLEIWKMNLNRLERRDTKFSRPIQFNKTKIMEFAESHWADNEAAETNWNGRQIKNAFQTAIALAEWDWLDSESDPQTKNNRCPVLKARHFKKVAKASALFEQYLIETRDKDSKNARASLNRKDNFKDTSVPTECGIRFPSYGEKQKKNKNKYRSPPPESDQDSETSDTSGSDTSDEESPKANKKALELVKLKQEKARLKREIAERQEKKKLQKQKKREQQQREEESAKKRENPLKDNGILTDDTDSLDDD